MFVLPHMAGMNDFLKRFVGQIVSEIFAQLCSDDSIQIHLRSKRLDPSKI